MCSSDLVLCWVCVSLCVTREEYEVNYTDHYDNEITQEQQRGQFLSLLVNSILLINLILCLPTSSSL